MCVCVCVWVKCQHHVARRTSISCLALLAVAHFWLDVMRPVMALRISFGLFMATSKRSIADNAHKKRTEAPLKAAFPLMLADISSLTLRTELFATCYPSVNFTTSDLLQKVQNTHTHTHSRATAQLQAMNFNKPLIHFDFTSAN